MKRKRQKTKAVWTAFFITLLVVQTGCAAKDKAGLPDGLFVQEDRIVRADGTGDTAEQESQSVSEEASQEEASGRAFKNGKEPEYVYVHICGEVQNPGVYRMPQGSRIYEAVERAGGLLDSAEETAVNQALAIEDGMKVWIPSLEETQSGGADSQNPPFVTGSTQTAEQGKAAGNCVNINTATESELCTLTGIGESRAKSIIQYRNEHGRFQRIEDIMKVTGIKDGAFVKIKDEIVVE